MLRVYFTVVLISFYQLAAPPNQTHLRDITPDLKDFYGNRAEDSHLGTHWVITQCPLTRKQESTTLDTLNLTLYRNDRFQNFIEEYQKEGEIPDFILYQHGDQMEILKFDEKLTGNELAKKSIRVLLPGLELDGKGFFIQQPSIDALKKILTFFEAQNKPIKWIDSSQTIGNLLRVEMALKITKFLDLTKTKVSVAGELISP